MSENEICIFWEKRKKNKKTLIVKQKQKEWLTHELTGIDQNQIIIDLVIDDEGMVVQIILYLDSVDKAENLSDIINKQLDNNPLGQTIRIKNVRVVGYDELDSASKIKISMFIVFITIFHHFLFHF